MIWGSPPWSRPARRFHASECIKRDSRAAQPEELQALFLETEARGMTGKIPLCRRSCMASVAVE